MLFLAVSFVMAGEEYKEDFSKTVPLKAGGHFSLENVNGGVSVSTWKEAKVEIKAVKTARRRQEDLAKVEIRRRGDRRGGLGQGRLAQVPVQSRRQRPFHGPGPRRGDPR